MKLESKHAVVTGGGSGVGAALGIALAEAGAAVTITGRRQGQLDEVAASHPNITAQPCDVTDRASLEEALGKARDRSGPIEVMVANAGVSSAKPFHRLSVEEMSATMDVNVIGVFNSLQLGLADMRGSGWGRLVVVASTAGLAGYPYVSHYCASKHAAVGMVRALAKELGGSGVTVNALCPSYVDTPMTDRTIDNIVKATGRTKDEALAELVAANPQGRLVTPEEIAGAALWLCGDSAAAINGQAIPIDGGEL